MKIKTNQSIVKQLTALIEAVESEYNIQKETPVVSEAGGADFIFVDMKKVLPNIAMLPNNVINTSKYQEHEIVDGLKKIGYEYKKPIGKKLHFFNKKTSVSIYLGQQTRLVTLQP
jgi:hypothetical protein